MIKATGKPSTRTSKQNPPRANDKPTDPANERNAELGLMTRSNVSIALKQFKIISSPYNYPKLLPMGIGNE